MRISPTASYKTRVVVQTTLFFMSDYLFFNIPMVTQLLYQLMHLYTIYTLKHYNCSDMFRSQDHHQGAVCLCLAKVTFMAGFNVAFNLLAPELFFNFSTPCI